MTTTTTGSTPSADHPPIGLLLRTLDRAITRRFETTLGGRGVTRRQWQLLNTLLRGPASAATLGEAVAPFLDEAAGEAVSDHLEPLAERHLVRVQDGRWALTEEGTAVTRDLLGEVSATRRATVAGVSEADYARTVGTLQRMISNLDSPSTR